MRAKLRSYHPDFTGTCIRPHSTAYYLHLHNTYTGSDTRSLTTSTESITQIYAAVFASFPEEAAVQGNLSRVLNSIVAIACLRTEGAGVGELLNGHALGLLRARDEPGLPPEDYWLASEEGLEWALTTVDMLLDVLRSDGSD